MSLVRFVDLLIVIVLNIDLKLFALELHGIFDVSFELLSLDLEVLDLKWLNELFSLVME